MIKALHILIFLFAHCYMLAQEVCDDVKYHKIRDSIQSLNFAFQPEKTIDITSTFLEQDLSRELLECEVYHWILYERGLAQQLHRKYAESLQTLYDLILKARAQNFHRIEAESYLTIALVHEFLGQNDSCEEGLRNALSIINSHDIKESYPRYCIRKSSLSRIIGNYAKAKDYALKAIASANQIGDTNNELDGYLLMGGFEKDPKLAINNFNKASDLFYKRQGYIGAASQTMNAASILFDNKKISQANQYLNKAFGYLGRAEEFNKDYYSTLSHYYNMKKEIFATKNNLDSALYFSEKYAEVLPNIFTYTNLSELKETETKFQVEIEKQKSKAEIKRSETLTKFIYLGSFLLACMSIMAYYLYRNKLKITAKNNQIKTQNNELLKSKEKSEMLLSEVHHRVKNNLQNMISLLIFKSNSLDSQTEKALLTDMQSKIMSLSIIHESLYQAGELEILNVNQYFHNFMSSFLQMHNSKNFTYDLNIEVEQLNIETMIPLGLMTSELITNATKYGTKADGSLAVEISMIRNNADGIIYAFSDDGKGYPEEILNGTSNSTGINILKSMSRQLRGNYELTNDNGAKLSLLFIEKISSKV